MKVDFVGFTKFIADAVGSIWGFIAALVAVILWIVTGPLFGFSDTWQLVINTGTTIITFLMVFIIQHTENRGVEILNLKLDELIKANKAASNSSIDLSKLSDEALKALEEKYEELCHKKK
jgi:low affinity Fe/Cu permease